MASKAYKVLDIFKDLPEMMDWWDEANFDDNLLFACVPMRHFSGRGFADRFGTLWAGWVILNQKIMRLFIQVIQAMAIILKKLVTNT